MTYELLAYHYMYAEQTFYNKTSLLKKTTDIVMKWFRKKTSHKRKKISESTFNFLITECLIDKFID